VAQEKQMRETLNTQHSTSNVESGNAELSVQRSALNASPARTVGRFFWRILDLIVAAIFIYAGAIKVLDPVQFATDIDNYKILPWTISVGLAFYLPWLEMFCGLALILRRLYLGGLSMLTGLVAVFLVATIAAKVRGLDITCGCFGHASQNWSFPTHLAVDLAILAALLALSFRVMSGIGWKMPSNSSLDRCELPP
jgi:putative oxidoreductase